MRRLIKKRNSKPLEEAFMRDDDDDYSDVSSVMTKVAE